MAIKWNRGHNLGRYPELKMTFTIIESGADCYPWHEVFAWYPVKTINGKRVWWKKVFKRKVWVVWGSGFHMEPVTQFGTLFDILSNE